MEVAWRQSELMLRTKKREIANFRANYATSADFCKVFERDTKSLYLLAFLLTANHKDAERCFVSTVDAAFKAQAVFKGWARSWVKRSLVKNAIQIVFSTSGRSAGKRDLWSVEQHGSPGDNEIDAATRLAPMERFMFVMSFLERYPAWECSLLLGCGMKNVAQLRRQALCGLRWPDALLPRAEEVFSGGLQIPA